MDLMVVVLVALFGGVLPFASIDAPLAHVGVAIPFVFVAPGYALTAAAFSKGMLGVPERVALSLGLSLVLTAVGGALLNLTPWGLQAQSWAVLIASTTLGASTIALVRRYRRTEAVERFAVGFTVRQGMLFTSAVIVLIGAVVVAYAGASQHQVGVTQLWILPAVHNPNAVQIGVRSTESERRYRLQVKAGPTKVREWPLIEIKPGETWITTAILPPGGLGTEPVEAVLYRLGSSGEVYRRVALRRSGERGQ